VFIYASSIRKGRGDDPSENHDVGIDGMIIKKPTPLKVKRVSRAFYIILPWRANSFVRCGKYTMGNQYCN